jgi:selenide,water dikinase
VETFDDAGVYRLPDGRALIHTVDFFTPVVDDPGDWGSIAAANALSDVYAMGGTPLVALQLMCWPSGDLPLQMLGEVARGGADKMAEAFCTVVGGHTIDDPEPKYGFAVTGTAPEERIVTNSGAIAGDRLVLTKPLGTGIVTTAQKADRCPEDVLSAAVAHMSALNSVASQAMVSTGVSAATDVTGYGLAGHLLSMLRASGAAARIEAGRLPVLPGAWDLLAAGYYPGGSRRNLEAVGSALVGGDQQSQQMACDAQTSGGLLISVSPDRLDSLRARLEAGGVTGWLIGTVTEGKPAIELV